MATAVAALPASAAEGTWSVTSSSRCQANEIIRLQTYNGALHDFTGTWSYGSQSGAESPAIYDGRGQLLEVCVFSWNGSAWVDQACGPAN